MKVRASHILVESEQKALSLMEGIKTGEDFARLAVANSSCPSGQRGGDLGEFGRGQMVKPFEDATFGMNVGDLSGPVQTQFGYHLILRTA
jgi:peptidyl-prolyl cis-trans isomerase C